MTQGAGPFELVVYPNGTASLKDPRTGEPMHSVIGPREEADLLYVQQSRLRDRLRAPDAAPLVIHDVGLGIAANALAAIECREELGADARRLEVASFETDPRGLEKALAEPERFPFLARHLDKCQALLGDGRWEAPDRSVSWTLAACSYLDALETAPPAELIFWDFYSPKSYPELWTREVFERVYAATQPRRERGLATTLLTYSAATAPRAAMLLAGFYVGYGRRTTSKTDTTVASTTLQELERPLEAKWLAKAECSVKLDRATYLEVREARQFVGDLR